MSHEALEIALHGRKSTAPKYEPSPGPAQLDYREILMRLAPPAPPCFEARDQWIEYLLAAQIASRSEHTAGPLILKRGEEVRFNHSYWYCVDCTAQKSYAMHKAGRCDPHYLMKLADEVDV